MTECWKIANLYFDPNANEGCWVIVFEDKSEWTILEHELNHYDCDNFLEAVSNLIDKKEYEKALMIKKHDNEVYMLKKEIAKLKGESQ